MAINNKGVSKGTIASYQDLDGLMKDWYGPKVVEQLNNKNWALDRIDKRGDMKWSGRKVMFPIHDRRNIAVGFRGETGTLPLAGGQRHQQAEVIDSLFYGTIEMTGLSLEAINSDRAGFKRGMESEMKGLVRDARDHFGFSIWHMPVKGANTSLNCIRARVAPAGAGGATPTLVTPGGYSGAPTGFGATRYLKVGDTVVWGTLVELYAGGVPPGVGRIESIDSAAQTITLADVTGVNPANDDYFVRGDRVTQGYFEYDNGLNGLGTITSDGQPGGGTFQALSLTAGADYSWRSYQQTSAGPFDEMEIHQLLNAIDETGDGEPSVLISHYSLHLEYLNSLQSQTRYKDGDFKGGYQVLTFASDKKYDWVIDKYCPYGHLFALEESCLFWAVRKDFHWDQKGGSILKDLAVSGDGKDGVRAFYKTFRQLGWEKLNAHGVLSNVTVSGTVL